MMLEQFSVGVGRTLAYICHQAAGAAGAFGDLASCFVNGLSHIVFRASLGHVGAPSSPLIFVSAENSLQNNRPKRTTFRYFEKILQRIATTER